MLFGIPAHFLIPIIGILAGTTMTLVLLYPFARALASRLEGNRGAAAQPVPADVSARLARIEATVESIAIEVERISEGQRFLTKLHSEQLPSSTPDRSR
jgi:hypothetical protein